MDKKKIMVVDDSGTMRLAISRIIGKDPALEVACTAANGKEALQKLSEVKPDVILLDIEMPEMDGLEFLRHARLRTRAKIIILSSLVGSDHRRVGQALGLGADAFVSKPSGSVSFDLEDRRASEIFQAIYKVLGMEMSPKP